VDVSEVRVTPRRYCLIDASEERLLRLATFNIAGANVPGRRTAAVQSRSWHWLASHGINLALVQEAEGSAIPEWVRSRWTLVTGELGQHGKSADWGSVIAADPSLRLRPRHDITSADPWLTLLYDYLVVGEIDLPSGETAIVASVHAVAKELSKFLKENIAQPPAAVFTEADLVRIAQLSDVAWVLDVAFDALARLVEGQRFIVGGDWNNARLFDEGRPGEPVASMFFTRASDRGWFECHQGDEEQTWLRPNNKPYQLDHIFTDSETARTVTACFAANGWPASELSDHAPLVTELDFGRAPVQ
jgi:hypothetical protein